MTYDRADWHYGGDFPKGQPNEAGGVHIGMFLAWAIMNHLEGEDFAEAPDSEAALEAVRNRQMTGCQFLFSECDEKFSEGTLNDEGEAFVADYYAAEDAAYFDDYEKALAKNLPTMYHVEDSWANYDVLARVLDRRFKAWRRKQSKA